MSDQKYKVELSNQYHYLILDNFKTVDPELEPQFLIPGSLLFSLLHATTEIFCMGMSIYQDYRVYF